MENIYHSAEQLIHKHIDLHGALHEASDTSGNEKLTATLSISDAISLVEAQSTLLGQQPSLLATAHIAKGILETLGTRIQDRAAYILQQHEKGTLDKWVNLAIAFRSSFMLHPHYLITCLLKDLQQLPLQLLWKLHTQVVIDLLDICTQMDEEKKLASLMDYLVSSVLALSCCEGQEVEEVITGVTGFLLALTFGPRESEDQIGTMREQSLSALHRIVDETYSLLHYPLCVFSPLEALTRCPTIKVAIATQFCMSVLTKCVHTPPFEPVTSAISICSGCSYSSQPLHCLALYKKLAEILGADEGVKALQVLMEEEINWVALLNFTICLLTNVPQAPARLSDTIHTMVSIAISEMERHTLYYALVLARHCAQEGSHLFPSYKDWFKRTFDSSHTALLTSKRSLLFFVRCLRDIVPYEPPGCLKVHLSCLTKCVPNSNEVLDEYRHLARTRLDNLKECDFSTSVETSPDSSVALMASHEGILRDVKEALESFRKSGEVPLAVKEARMFRGPYFRYNFLPALLNPTILDDQDDIRERFIEAMLSVGFIPQKLIAGYRTAKSSRKSQLREADTDEVQLISTHPLVASMNKLVESVKQGEAMQAGLSALSASIEKHIQVHRKSRKGEEPSPVQLDLCSPGLYRWEVELVDCLLSTLLECIMVQANKNSGFPWIQSFLDMLSRHKDIHVALLVRLWELMHVQLPALTDCQITCLAILCSEMCNCPQPVQGVCLINHVCPLDTGTSTTFQEIKSMSLYGSWLVSVLPHVAASCALGAFRFYCVFTEHSVSCHTTGLQVSVAEKLHYLYSKYSFLEKCWTQERGTGTYDNQSQINHLTLQWTNLLQVYNRLHDITSNEGFGHAQMCFSNWITNELASSDDFPEHMRRHYQRKTFYEHYLTTPVLSGGLGGDMGGAFSQLFAVLVKMDTCRSTVHSCVCRNHVGGQGWCNGVQLLQEIAFSLSAETNELQLARAFQYTQEQNVSGENEEKRLFNSYYCSLLAQAQLRVAVCLPQYMFFCNALTPSDQNWGTMVTQTAALLEHLPPFNDTHILPLDLTVHLLQGLGLILRLTNTGREVTPMYQMSAFHQFVHTCPLFGVSLVAHWSQIREAIQLTTIPGNIAELIESFSQWIHCGIFKLSSLQLPIPHSDLLEWPLVIGGCVFHHLQTSHASVGAVCTDLKMLLPSLSGKIFCTLLWCALGNACRNLHTLLLDTEPCVLRNNWDSVAICTACITVDPSVVIMFEGVLSDSKDTGLLADLRKHFPLCLVPCAAAILFMVLSQVSTDTFKQLTLQQPAFLKLCVRAHKLFLQEVESTWPVGGESSNLCDSIISRPVSAGFIEMCATRTMAAIRQSSPCVMQECVELCHDTIKPYLIQVTRTVE